MLTFVEAISLAGDRKKQNDDAFGSTRKWAWVIDGATDLHEPPMSGYGSDAAWLATYLNERLASSALGYDIFGSNAEDLQHELREASDSLRKEWAFDGALDIPKWQFPIASALLVAEFEGRLEFADLGDCRCFILDADGAVHVLGGPEHAVEAETRLAAQQTDAHKPLLLREATIARLREMRGALNREGAEWTFCLDPACADHVRVKRLEIRRPAHVLLMTDGFAALVDRYGAYDAASLVCAVVDRGLQELGRELRAIETSDAGAALHPRFKTSDDATALLMRLTD
jgi:hypothetical protein